MTDDLARWAKKLGEAYEDIALILLLEPRGRSSAPSRGLDVCLVMRDGEKVPWFAEGKGIEGLAYAKVPGRDVKDRILADECARLPELQLYMNFCDSRGMMFTYRNGEERLAGEDIVDFRYRILYPERPRIPPLEEFFYLWGEETGMADRGPSQGKR